MMEEKQAGVYCRNMTEEEKELLAENIGGELMFELRDIRECVLRQLKDVDGDIEKILRKRFYF